MKELASKQHQAAASGSGLIYAFCATEKEIGLSMALANVAVVLAQNGKSTLIVDGDIGGRGIQRYLEPIGFQSSVGQMPGLSDLIVARTSDQSLDWNDCLVDTRPAAHMRSISILTAGRKVKENIEATQVAAGGGRVGGPNLGEYLHKLREQWITTFDVVLLDTTIGLAGFSRMLTAVWADSIVLMITATSIESATELLARTRDMQNHVPIDCGRVVAVPVYQKAANGGPEQAIDWQGLVSGELGKLFRDWLPVDVPEAEALQRLSFPREERADGGPLAVLGKTSDTPDDQTLGAAYRQLGLLIANELDWGVFESTSVEQEERGLILEDSTSTTLIEQVKAGKQDAWVKFVDLYGPLVYRWCREKGQGPEEAQDIGQEVFRKVATHISSYHRDRPGSFCGWLRVITKNAIVDFSRQSQKQPDACGGTEAQILFGEVPDPVDDELDDTAVRDDVYLVHRALDQVRHEFADNVFQAFSKMTIDEYSSREVAEELNMTPNSVRQAKFRVLQRLRELLADVS